MKLLYDVEARQMKSPAEIPKFHVGDTVRVSFRIIEGQKERTQIFEGVVISRKRRESANARFTVRRTTHGEGVERVFPLHSPRVEKVEVVKEGQVRRAKLHYLRDLSGKAARVKARARGALAKTAPAAIAPTNESPAAEEKAAEETPAGGEE